MITVYVCLGPEFSTVEYKDVKSWQEIRDGRFMKLIVDFKDGSRKVKISKNLTVSVTETKD